MTTIPKKPGKCIFCNASGLTKEHLYANWLRNFIPRKLSNHHLQTSVIYPDKSDRVLHHRAGDPHSRTIKCVCRKCNNGWMGTLQEDAKPYLIPLLENRQIILHRKAQTRLASWVAMTVMVGEFLDQGMTAIPVSERRLLHTNQKPPKYWRIWIGRHQRKDHPLWTHNVMALADEEVEESLLGTPAESNTHTSTILFGEHFIVHVMSSKIAWNIIRRWQLPPQIEPMMCQIWPLRTSRIGWPPSERLEDTAIGHMAQQFFNRVHDQLMIDSRCK